MVAKVGSIDAFLDAFRHTGGGGAIPESPDSKARQRCAIRAALRLETIRVCESRVAESGRVAGHKPRSPRFPRRPFAARQRRAIRAPRCCRIGRLHRGLSYDPLGARENGLLVRALRECSVEREWFHGGGDCSGQRATGRLG
jgi:hypothetical protein